LTLASPADEYLRDRKKIAFTTSSLHIAKNIIHFIIQAGK
jgi:hypothetical protein